MDIGEMTRMAHDIQLISEGRTIAKMAKNIPLPPNSLPHGAVLMTTEFATMTTPLSGTPSTPMLASWFRRLRQPRMQSTSFQPPNSGRRSKAPAPRRLANPGWFYVYWPRHPLQLRSTPFLRQDELRVAMAIAPFRRLEQQGDKSMVAPFLSFSFRPPVLPPKLVASAWSAGARIFRSKLVKRARTLS